MCAGAEHKPNSTRFMPRLRYNKREEIIEI